jgi:excisionase family DNA binding protein
MSKQTVEPRTKAEPEFISVPEAARMLSVHERTVWSLIEDEDDPIPTYRIGRLRRIERAELREWMRRRRQEVQPSKVSRIVDDVLNGLR